MIDSKLHVLQITAARSVKENRLLFINSIHSFKQHEPDLSISSHASREICMTLHSSDVPIGLITADTEFGILEVLEQHKAEVLEHRAIKILPTSKDRFNPLLLVHIAEAATSSLKRLVIIDFRRWVL